MISWTLQSCVFCIHHFAKNGIGFYPDPNIYDKTL